MSDNQKIRAVIVDDELNCIEILQYTLAQYCPEVEVIRTFQHPKQALEEIPQLQPDVLFTDIDMPHINGLELVQQLQQPKIKTIFVTAFNEYALKAIKLSAADYLLKPVDGDDLRQAIQKINQLKQEENGTLLSLLNILNSQKNIGKLAIHSEQSIQFIDYSSIIYCKSEGPYTEFYLTGKKTILASRSLGEYEDLTSEQGFFRIHHSYLINLHHLDKFVKKDGGYVVMSDGTTLTVARRKKDDFLNKISG